MNRRPTFPEGAFVRVRFIRRAGVAAPVPEHRLATVVGSDRVSILVEYADGSRGRVAASRIETEGAA